MNLFQKVGSALSGGKPASGTTPSTPASQPATEADFAPVLQVSALDVLSDRPRAKAAPPAAEPPKPAPKQEAPKPEAKKPDPPKK